MQFNIKKFKESFTDEEFENLKENIDFNEILELKELRKEYWKLRNNEYKKSNILKLNDIVIKFIKNNCDIQNVICLELFSIWDDYWPKFKYTKLGVLVTPILFIYSSLKSIDLIENFENRIIYFQKSEKKNFLSSLKYQIKKYLKGKNKITIINILNKYDSDLDFNFEIDSKNSINSLISNFNKININPNDTIRSSYYSKINTLYFDEDINIPDNNIIKFEI